MTTKFIFLFAFILLNACYHIYGFLLHQQIPYPTKVRYLRMAWHFFMMLLSGAAAYIIYDFHKIYDTS